MKKLMILIMLVAVVLVLSACQSGQAGRIPPKALMKEEVVTIMTPEQELAQIAKQREFEPVLRDFAPASEGVKIVLEGNDCLLLTQSDFENETGYYNQTLNTFYLMMDEGCVELNENIYFDGGINLAGGFTFYGNGYTLGTQSGNGWPHTAMSVYNSVTVMNLFIEQKFIGLVLRDNSTALNVSINSTTMDAFMLLDNSLGDGLLAINNPNRGFWVKNFARCYNCDARANKYGFMASDYAQIVHSTADYNILDGFNFYLHSTGTNLLSENNGDDGITLDGNSAVYDSVSRSNGEYGFLIYNDAAVYTSEAINNLQVGFLGSSTLGVFDSIARNNVIDGFLIRATRSLAEDNGGAGFGARTGISYTDCIARNNDVGFEIGTYSNASNIVAEDNRIGAILVGTYASLFDGGRACGNDDYDMDTGSASYNRLTGMFKATNIVGNGDVSQAIIRSCVKPRPDLPDREIAMPVR